MTRIVTLTDEAGAPTGEMEIVAAHTNGGTLHRAISVYVFDPTFTSMLLQQRSQKKFLFAGIWANTCCSHPFPGESAKAAGERRLMEEMNFTTILTEGPAFVYTANDPQGKGTEHEYDIILTGTEDPTKPIAPNPEEAADATWVTIANLQTDMKERPSIYAPWFHLGLPLALRAITQ